MQNCWPSHERHHSRKSSVSLLLVQWSLSLLKSDKEHFSKTLIVSWIITIIEYFYVKSHRPFNGNEDCGITLSSLYLNVRRPREIYIL